MVTGKGGGGRFLLSPADAGRRVYAGRGSCSSATRGAGRRAPYADRCRRRHVRSRGVASAVGGGRVEQIGLFREAVAAQPEPAGRACKDALDDRVQRGARQRLHGFAQGGHERRILMPRGQGGQAAPAPL